ncbi:hypothetical protein [Ilumatobacter sp.]|uniref:hypothetical protein n=1 Tax=Ilumatobacter sp. TaxID=1967498 RepID=UPI003C6ED3D3
MAASIQRGPAGLLDLDNMIRAGEARISSRQADRTEPPTATVTAIGRVHSPRVAPEDDD